MSTHLTDEQLSARHDDALGATERATVDAHLADCAACRARLAEFAELDASLAGALAHEPGEAYFEGLADRVAARVAAERAGTTRPRPRWSGWFAPRVLAWSGAVAALALVSVLALRMSTPQSSAPVAALEPAAPTAESMPLSSAPAPSSDAAPPLVANDEPAPARAPAAESPRTSRREPIVSPPSPPVAAMTAPVAERAQEPRAMAAAPAPEASAQAAPVAEAAPSAPAASTQAAPAPTPRSAAPTWSGREAAKGFAGALQGFAAPPTSSWSASPAPLTASPSPRDLRCGQVRDSRGTPLMGAQVTALGRTARMTRSGRDGRFCFDTAITGDTLVVLRVGFEPTRRVVAVGDSLVIELQPVGTLGPRGTPPSDR